MIWGWSKNLIISIISEKLGRQTSLTSVFLFFLCAKATVWNGLFGVRMVPN